MIKQKKEQFRSIAVFPCKLKIMPEHIYMSRYSIVSPVCTTPYPILCRDPIVVGVQVTGGVLRTGTPLCVPSKEFIYIGICTGIQHNSKDVDTAKKGDEVSRQRQGIIMPVMTNCNIYQVCVKIESPGGDAPKMFGRHFDETDLLTSRVSS